MGKRILVLSASVGAGHIRAAQAVELALRELAPQATIQNIDILTMTNAAFRQVYGKAYLDLVNKAPHVLGFVYDMMDKPVKPKNPGDRLRLMVEKLNLTRFRDMLEEAHWDVVINTHFLPAEIIANLRNRGKIAQRHRHGDRESNSRAGEPKQRLSAGANAADAGSEVIRRTGYRTANAIRLFGLPQNRRP